MQQAPQFGDADPGVNYRDRPAAFGLGLRDGRLALVRVTYPDKAPFFDLPGGGVDAGESPEQALIREFGEETGLIVQVGPRLGLANQRFRRKNGEPTNNLCTFFEVEVQGADTRLKIEQDHELVWVEPVQALKALRLEAQAWALTLWLRKCG